MNLKFLPGFFSALLIAGTAGAGEPTVEAEASAPSRVEFPLNGLSFVLDPARRWKTEMQIDTPSTHLTYRSYASDPAGHFVDVIAKNTPVATAGIEIVMIEYQNHVFADGRLKILGFRRGLLDGLPAAFFDVLLSDDGRTEHGLVALTVLHGQSYNFSLRTIKEAPAADPFFQTLLASIKISRTRPLESRSSVPQVGQIPDQIVGNPRIEAELDSRDAVVKWAPSMKEVISRLGPPEIIHSKGTSSVFVYTFGRYNYLNKVGVSKRYEITFGPGENYEGTFVMEKPVSEPFPVIEEPPPPEEPTERRKPKPEF